METKFQTSFIPKSSILPQDGISRPKKNVGIFFAFSFFILLISLLFAASCVGFVTYYTKQKVSMDADLNKSMELFERRTIEDYVRLDKRIVTAKNLLANHIALSSFLDFLQKETLQSLRFNDMKYDLSVDGKYATVIMNGVAKSYNAIAFQANEFAKNKELAGAIFSNFDLDLNGNVVFSFGTRINSNFIYYKNSKAGSVVESATVNNVNTNNSEAELFLNQ